MPKRITIKEIADQAGVSPGTVDRILHNRGNVSRRSLAAVNRVLEATGYIGDNYFAATAKPCLVAVVTPTSTVGDYWSAVYDGIRQALKDLPFPGISVKYFQYNQFDVYSCLMAQNAVLKWRPDAVIVGPTFLEEAHRFCTSLEEDSIPYVFVDSSFSDTKPMATFSTDQLSGGKAMAHLLTASTSPGDRIAVFGSRNIGSRVSTNTTARQDGFMAFIREAGRAGDLTDTCYTSTVPAENERTIRSLLDRYGDISGIAVLNSRGSVIAEILEDIGLSHVKIISFDLTSQNVECLRKGSIHALLCQHPFRQGYLAATTLVRYVMQGVAPEKVSHFLPIDIVLKETIDLYEE